MDIPKLIDEFNNTDVKDMTLDFLVDLGDALKFAKWEYRTLLQVAQRHIDLLSQFPDKQIMQQLDLNFVNAFSNYEHDLSEVSFEPIINGLDKTDNLAFISMTIHFLSATGDRKYASIVRSYLDYSNPAIQDIAKDCMKYLK